MHKLSNSFTNHAMQGFSRISTSGVARACVSYKGLELFSEDSVSFSTQLLDSPLLEGFPNGKTLTETYFYTLAVYWSTSGS